MMNFCCICCRSLDIVKVYTMCWCQVQILVLLAHRLSEIKKALCVWFEGSNFAPWTQTLFIFVMKFS
jgi:hypothetical protein